MTWVTWTVLAVGLLALAAGVVLTVRARHTETAAATDAEAVQELVVIEPEPVVPTGDPTGMFETTLVGIVEDGDALVVPDPSDPDLVMVFGPRTVATSLGDIVGGVPGQLATVAVGADALVKAGIAMGEESGMLVRLTQESTRAMKELNQIKDGSGAVMGVLRDGGAKFRHVVRFKPQQGLQLASSATGILSAVAMQAQLAAIERAIAQLSLQVQQVREMLAIASASERAAVATVLMSTYEASTKAGVLSQSAWDQVAPMATTVEKVAEEARRQLNLLLDDLEKQRSTGDRRAWFTKYEQSLIDALEAVASTERSRMQYSALRLWWLGASHDPLLEPYTEQMQQLALDQEQRRISLGDRLGALLDDAEQTWWWDHVHSPIDSRKVRTHVRALSNTLRQGGIVPSVEAGSRDVEITSRAHRQVEGPDQP